MSIHEKALALGLKAGARATRTALTYTRPDAVAPTDLKGTQGKKLFKIQEPGQPVTMVETVDFLILAADLVIDGSLTEPMEDDYITRIQGSKKNIFRVLSPGGDEPVFHYSDTGNTMLRIHTKFYDQEDVV